VLLRDQRRPVLLRDQQPGSPSLNILTDRDELTKTDERQIQQPGFFGHSSDHAVIGDAQPLEARVVVRLASGVQERIQPNFLHEIIDLTSSNGADVQIHEMNLDLTFLEETFRCTGGTRRSQTKQLNFHAFILNPRACVRVVYFTMVKSYAVVSQTSNTQHRTTLRFHRNRLRLKQLVI
jgi:hypothetical protein